MSERSPFADPAFAEAYAEAQGRAALFRECLHFLGPLIGGTAEFQIAAANELVEWVRATAERASGDLMAAVGQRECCLNLLMAIEDVPAAPR